MPATHDKAPNAKLSDELRAVLFVEDDMDDFVIAHHALQKLKVRNPVHRVPCADIMMDYLHGSGEYADREKYPLPAVIFMDLRLPRVSGLQAQARLRSSLKLRKIPIVAISSEERLNALKSAVQLGADGYMLKPFDRAAFREIADSLNLHVRFDA